MENIKLENDEIIILNEIVSLDNIDNVKLTLTNKKMIFRKEKGFFKKKLRVIEELPLSDIKVYNDKVQINQDKDTITIQATNKNITLACNNFITARKIIEEVTTIKTGKSVFERGMTKINSFANNFNKSQDTIKAIGGVASIIIGVLGLSGKLPFGKKK